MRRIFAPRLARFSSLMVLPVWLDKQIFKNQVVQGRGLRRIHWVCKHSDNAEIRRLLIIWWVWMDSNHRPPPYQDGALTSWATDPIKVTITLSVMVMLANLFLMLLLRTTDKCECLQLRFFSLERRWSSRTFRYGYLVTTSPQSWILPW